MSKRSGGVLALALLCAGLSASFAGEETKPPTVEEVRALQKKYRDERDRLAKTGAIKVFLPNLLDQAEIFGGRADEALGTGRVVQAAEAFRHARWQLPYLGPDAPAHLARVFGNLRLRHGQEINSAAFSPDGKFLATASRDRGVKIWDLANGHEALHYRGHGDLVRCVAYSPDGKLIASGGGERHVKLWDPLGGGDVRTLTWKDQGQYVTCIAFSRDGKTLVVGTDATVLRLYDVASGSLKREIREFQQMVLTVAFSHDGALLCAGSGDGSLLLWEYPKVLDAQKNQPSYWTQQDLTGSSLHVAFSPDNRTIVRCAPDGIKLYDVQAPAGPGVVKQPRRLIQPPQPSKDARKVLNNWYTCAVFNKDGKVLYTGGTDSIIRLWDVDTGQPIGTFKGHNDEIRALVFNASGNMLASASSDHTVRLWHFNIVSQARDFLGHDGSIWTATFSPDGQRIVSASADKTVRIWDMTRGKVLRTLTGHQAGVTAALYSPEGKHIVSAGGERTLNLWNAESGDLVRTFQGHLGTVTTVAFNAGGGKIASGGADKLVKIWDAQSGKELVGIAVPSIVTVVAFTPDDKQIIVGSADQMLRLFDVATGKPGTSWLAHNAAVTALAYSPNGKLLVTCGADQLVRIWQTATPETTPITLATHNGPLSAVAFRNDNVHFVSAGSDQVVKLWKLENGSAKEIQSFRGHRDWISSVAFSRDGFYLASAGIDQVIKIWEITSREIPLQSEHTGAVEAVVVSPDGKWVASGATDRAIKIWDRMTGVEKMTLHGHSQGVIALAFALDGKHLFSSGADRNIRLWDLTAGKELPRLEGHQENFSNLLNPAPHFQVHPDGKQLLTWIPGSDHYTTIAGFDWATGKQLFTFNDVKRNIGAVAFTKDGKLAGLGAADGSVRLYDLTTRKVQAGADWFVFNKGVSALGFTPDNATLVAGSDTGEVCVANLAKKDIVHRAKGHAYKVALCAVSPDGKRFATAGIDNVVKVWDTASGKELRSWDMRLRIQERGGFVAQLAFSPDGRHLLTANANTTLYMLEVP
jgi:WD40 repeat protein